MTADEASFAVPPGEVLAKPFAVAKDFAHGIVLKRFGLALSAMEAGSLPLCHRRNERRSILDGFPEHVDTKKGVKYEPEQ